MQVHLLADIGLNPPTIAAFVAMAALIYSITRWRRNMINKKKAVPEREFQPKTPQTSMRLVNTEVESLLGEIEETSRRLTAQIDNRYMRLEQLLSEADEKIKRLEQLAPLQPPPSIAPPPVPALERSAAPSTSENQRALSRLRQERGAPPAGEDPAYQPIYTLADGGKSPREIAQELGRQPGEIELILALRGR